MAQHGGPAWARGLAGRRLGVALAERAAELSASDEADVDDLTEALRLAADDEAAMAAFFGALEPVGLLQLVTNLASADHRSIELPLLLREQFVQTAHAGGIHAGYGRRFVRSAAVVQHEQRGPTGDAGLRVVPRPRRRPAGQSSSPRLTRPSCRSAPSWLVPDWRRRRAGRSGLVAVRPPRSASGSTSTSPTAATTSTPWRPKTRCTPCSASSVATARPAA